MQGCLFLLVIFQMNCANLEVDSLPPKETVVDQYFGTSVYDDYRYMEDKHNDIAKDWILSQSTLCNRKLNAVSNASEIELALKSMEAKQDWEIKNVVLGNSNYIFYLKRGISEQQFKLYRKNIISDKEEQLYDPEKSVHKYDVNKIIPSGNDSLLMLGMTNSDTELSLSKIFNCNTKSFYPSPDINHIYKCDGFAWIDDSRFVCNHFPQLDIDEPSYLKNCSFNLYEFRADSIRFIKLLLNYEKHPSLVQDDENIFYCYDLNNESKYLIVQQYGSKSNYADALIIEKTELFDDKALKWTKYWSQDEKIYDFYSTDSILFYTSKKEFGEFELFQTTINNPDFNNSKLLSRRLNGSTFGSFLVNQESIYYTRIINGIKTKLYHLSSSQLTEEIEVPGGLSKLKMLFRRSSSKRILLGGSGWIVDRNWLILNTDNHTFNIPFSNSKVDNSQRSENYNVEEVEIPSHDGTLVPLSIMYKRGLSLNGNSRLLIIGYGAFAHTYLRRIPEYAEKWIEWGGVLAVAHVRGGGEKGESWYNAGRKSTKPNTWKDFNACTEYLIDNGYAAPDKVVSRGASAGAICVGRAMIERPDLYSGVIVEVGLLNAVRHEFGSDGPTSAREFGSVYVEEEFPWLLDMDCYHSLEKNVEYPAVFVYAGAQDPRVPIFNSAKFVARLKEYNKADNPALLYVDSNSGHNANMSKATKSSRYSKMLAFALWQTGHPDYQIKQ